MQKVDAISHNHAFFAKRRFNHASPVEWAHPLRHLS